MEKLLEQAKKFLDENPQFYSISLCDGINTVTVTKDTSYTYQYVTPLPYLFPMPSNVWKP